MRRALVIAFALFTASPALAGKTTVLHAFAHKGDGGFPISGVARDKHGNVFGTTSTGGTGDCPDGCGNVYEIAADGTFSVVYAFKGADGANPNGAPVFDDKGNLYGTTVNGGAAGCGIVYKLSPGRSGGRWSETIIHDFAAEDPNDGCNSTAALAFARSGNLYGTTSKGGGGGVGGTYCRNGCGTVFQLRQKGKRWKERILHTFPGTAGSTDGQNPYGAVALDYGENVWGTTEAGGTGGASCNPSGTGCGTVFELVNVFYNDWEETELFSFQDTSTGWSPHEAWSLGFTTISSARR